MRVIRLEPRRTSVWACAFSAVLIVLGWFLMPGVASGVDLFTRPRDSIAGCLLTLTLSAVCGLLKQ